MASPFERAFNPAFQQASAAAMKSLDDERQENRFQQRMLEQRQYDASLLEGSKAYAAELLKGSTKIDQDRIDAATKLAAQRTEQANFPINYRLAIEAGVPASALEGMTWENNAAILAMTGREAQGRKEGEQWASTGALPTLTNLFGETPDARGVLKKFDAMNAERKVADAATETAAKLRSTVSGEQAAQVLTGKREEYFAKTGRVADLEDNVASLNKKIDDYNKDITESEGYKGALDEAEQEVGEPLKGGLPLEKLKSITFNVKAVNAFNIERAKVGLPPLSRWTDPDVQIPRVQGKPEIRTLTPTDHGNLEAAKKSTALADFRKEIDIRAISSGKGDAISKATDAISRVEGIPKKLRDAMASGSYEERANAAMEILSYVRSVPIENLKGETTGFRLVYANPPELRDSGVGGGELEFGPQPSPTAAQDAAAEKAAAAQAAAAKAAKADQANIDKAVAIGNAAATVRKQQITDGIKAKWDAGLFDARTGNAQRAVIESVIKRGGIKLEDVVGDFSSLAFQINSRNYLNSRDGLENAQDKYLDAVKAAAIPNQSVSERASKQKMVTEATEQLKQAKLTMELLDEELQGIKNNKFTPRIRGSSSKFQPQPTR